MPVYPKPNTQPIYPKKIFTWRGELLNQVITIPVPISNTLQTVLPIKLGEAQEAGALIWAFHIALPLPYYGHFHFYSRRTGDTNLVQRWMHLVNTSDLFSFQVCNLPAILPNEQKGLHLEAGEELFVMMQIAVTSPITVIAVGGHY